MNDAEFRNAKTLLLHEAMARYLCQWLDEQGLLWRFTGGGETLSPGISPGKQRSGVWSARVPRKRRRRGGNGSWV